MDSFIVIMNKLVHNSKVTHLICIAHNAYVFVSYVTKQIVARFYTSFKCIAQNVFHVFKQSKCVDLFHVC